MNRQIKFRAIVGVNSNDENTIEYFDLSKVDDLECMAKADYDINQLMQFTGLKDNSGKEIYEGDVIEYYGGKRIVDFTPCDGLKLGIIYNETVNGIRQTHENWSYSIASSSKIIGNIYENKELIKQQ